MGFFLANPSDPNQGAHEVFITGYNNNGNAVYIDPQTGAYGQISGALLLGVYQITGLKP